MDTYYISTINNIHYFLSIQTNKKKCANLDRSKYKRNSIKRNNVNNKRLFAQRK